MNLKKHIKLKEGKGTDSLLNEEDKLFLQQLIQKIEKNERQGKAEIQDGKKD